MNRKKKVNRPRLRKLPLQKPNLKDENLSSFNKPKVETPASRMSASSVTGSVIQSLDLNTPLLSRLQGILDAKQKKEDLAKQAIEDQNPVEVKLEMAEKEAAVMQGSSIDRLANNTDSKTHNVSVLDVVESVPDSPIEKHSIPGGTPGSPAPGTRSPLSHEQNGQIPANSSRCNDSTLTNSGMELDGSESLDKAFVADSSTLLSISGCNMDTSSPTAGANVMNRKTNSQPAGMHEATMDQSDSKHIEMEEFVQSLILNCLPTDDLTPVPSIEDDCVVPCSGETVDPGEPVSFTSIETRTSRSDGQESCATENLQLSPVDLGSRNSSHDNHPETHNVIQGPLAEPTILPVTESTLTSSSQEEPQPMKSAILCVKRKRSKSTRIVSNKRPKMQPKQPSDGPTSDKDSVPPGHEQTEVSRGQGLEMKPSAPPGAVECQEKLTEDSSTVDPVHDHTAEDQTHPAEIGSDTNRTRMAEDNQSINLTVIKQEGEPLSSTSTVLSHQAAPGTMEDPGVLISPLTAACIPDPPCVLPVETTVSRRKRRQPKGKGSQAVSAECHTDRFHEKSESPNMIALLSEKNTEESDLMNDAALQPVPPLSEKQCLFEDLVLPFDDELNQKVEPEQSDHNPEMPAESDKTYSVTSNVPVTVDSLVLPFDDISSETSSGNQSAILEDIPAKRKKGRRKGRRSRIHHKVQTQQVSVDDMRNIHQETTVQIRALHKSISPPVESAPAPMDKGQNHLTMDNLVLPFDDEVGSSVCKASLESGNVSASQTPTDQKIPKSRKRKGRRSADFEIMNSIIPSPRTSASPNKDSPTQASYLPLGQPNIRRSHRLKRKSLEIYRAANRKMTDPVSGPDTSVDTVLSPQQNELLKSNKDNNASDRMESSDNVKSPCCALVDSVESPKQQDPQQSHKSSVDVANVTVEDVNSDFPATSIGNDETSSSDPTIESDVSSTGRPRRKKQEPKLVVESTKPSPAKKGRKGKAVEKVEPSVEEIYLNKLWRTQMPTEKSWETIYENPSFRPGRDDYQSSKKFKRNIHFDEFYAKNRLKKRRQKALKQGWKPLTSKRHTKAAQLLEEKLDALQEDLDFIEQDITLDDKAEDCTLSDDTNRICKPVTGFMPHSHQEEDIFFTPAKSVSDLLAYVEEPPTETQTKMDFETLSECTESSSDSQIFQTPLKELSELAGSADQT